MNFFHDLLEIPDWEKDIVLLSYVHIYIYTCCSQIRDVFGYNSTSSVCFSLLEACMISFSLQSQCHQLRGICLALIKDENTIQLF